MPFSLTKSTYLLGHQCEKALWLRMHRNDLATPVRPGLQRLFDEGHLVGRLAHRLFPNGRLITAEPKNYTGALEETAALFREANTPVFEGAGKYDDVFVRADVLRPTEDGWDLIEVKSSTEVKEEHYHDLAIQWYVLSGAGIPLRRAFLLHINRDYVRDGEIDPAKIFVFALITDQVKMHSKGVPILLERFRKAVEQSSTPLIDISAHCRKPYECRFYEHCWDGVPATSIHYLPRLSEKKRVLLREEGVSDLRDVKDDFPLTDIQKRWWRAARSEKPLIDLNRLRDFLSTLQYPLCFLDFETINLAIPPFDGLRPYVQVPFQVSVRILNQNGEEQHHEFLGDGQGDPRPALARFLADVVPKSGSVIAYNASFEKGCLQRLIPSAPEHTNSLSSICDRLWDLKDAFSDGMYLDSRFGGSASIKDVLPVLVPELSYEGLAIRDGGEATAAYMKLSGNGLAEEERSSLKAALLAYCGQDTKAMVKIIEQLIKATQET